MRMHVFVCFSHLVKGGWMPENSCCYVTCVRVRLASQGGRRCFAVGLDKRLFSTHEMLTCPARLRAQYPFDSISPVCGHGYGFSHPKRQSKFTDQWRRGSGHPSSVELQVRNLFWPVFRYVWRIHTSLRHHTEVF